MKLSQDSRIMPRMGIRRQCSLGLIVLARPPSSIPVLPVTNGFLSLGPAPASNFVQMKRIDAVLFI